MALFSTLSRHLVPALALVLFGFTTAALADNPSAGQAKGDKGMEQRHRMTEELKLNDKQKELFKAAMQQKIDNMQSGMELHEQVRALTISDKYDEKKVRELVQKHNKEMEDNIVESSKNMHTFYSSLTPEQKTKFNEMHNEQKDRMKGGLRDHMGGGPKGGHMGRPDNDNDSGKDE